MDYEIRFGGDPEDLTIALSGIAEVADLLRLNTELATDPRFQSGLLILVDITQLDTTHLTETAVAEVTAPVGERDWDHPPLGVAIVAGDGPAASDAQLWRAHLGGTRSQRRIFSTTEQALHWLRTLRPSSGSA